MSTSITERFLYISICLAAHLISAKALVSSKIGLALEVVGMFGFMLYK